MGRGRNPQSGASGTRQQQMAPPKLLQGELDDTVDAVLRASDDEPGGWCVQAASLLCFRLRRRGIDARVQVGSYHYPLEVSGLVHHFDCNHAWVVARIDGHDWIADATRTQFAGPGRDELLIRADSKMASCYRPDPTQIEGVVSEPGASDLLRLYEDDCETVAFADGRLREFMLELAPELADLDETLMFG